MAKIICATCREPIWLEDIQDQTLRRSGATFYCLWGHQNVFGKGPSEAELMRQERDRLAQRIAQKDDEIAAARRTAERHYEERQAAERRASAARGQVTKLKKRAANGVCPCCNRTFADLQRHMATKHAGFLAEKIQAENGVVH